MMVKDTAIGRIKHAPSGFLSVAETSFNPLLVSVVPYHWEQVWFEPFSSLHISRIVVLIIPLLTFIASSVLHAY